MAEAVVVLGISELTTLSPDADPSGAGADVDRLGLLTDAAVVIEDGVVAWVGPESAVPQADRAVDLGGRAVIPAFVDSHTHLVFAGDRAAEFTARMTGTPYDGGGIATTVSATRSASDDQLRQLLARRVEELRRQGTTRFEIKSGYGLTVEDELRLLRIAREFTPHTTLLGAHVIPPEYREDRPAYIDLVTGPMLTAASAPSSVSGAQLAAYLDVFCEPNSAHAFTGEEAHHILTAGREAGLALRVHGNQLGHGPGVQLACELGAVSVDHCTYLSDSDVDALVECADTTVATLLPGVEFSTRSPYPDARGLLDRGVAVGLASDCNPGTCYSSSMALVIALAVREMGLTPAEALYATTAVPARTLGLAAGVRVGAPAELAVIDGPSYLHLAYRPGVPIVTALSL